MFTKGLYISCHCCIKIFFYQAFSLTRELIMLTTHEVETVFQFAVEVDIFLIDMFNILQLDRHTLSIAVRFLKAKTPEQRAAVDLDTHYSKVQTALHSIILLSVNSASIISERKSGCLTHLHY